MYCINMPHFQQYSSTSVALHHRRPTQRALDSWDSARFLRFVLDYGSFPFPNFSLPSRQRWPLAIFFAHNKCVLSPSPRESLFRLPLCLERDEQILQEKEADVI